MIVVDQSGREEVAGVVREYLDRFPLQHIRDAGRGAARPERRAPRAVCRRPAADIVAFPMTTALTRWTPSRRSRSSSVAIRAGTSCADWCATRAAGSASLSIMSQAASRPTICSGGAWSPQCSCAWSVPVAWSSTSHSAPGRPTDRTRGPISSCNISRGGPISSTGQT